MNTASGAFKDQNAYEALKQAALDAIAAPYDEGWDDAVMNALEAMETYETAHGLEDVRQSHTLLEDAVLNILKSNTEDMTLDESLDALRKLGVEVNIADVTMGEHGRTGVGRTFLDNLDNTVKSYGNPDPRFAKLIVALKDRGLDLEKDLSVNIIPREQGSIYKEPYVVLSLRNWGRQIALCNLSRMATYVGQDIRSPDEWAEILSDKTALADNAADLGIAVVKKVNLSDDDFIKRLLRFAEHGVSDAEITAEIILDGMYAVMASEDAKIPENKYGESPLRPGETFLSYATALFKGRFEGEPKGSTIKSLLLKDLERRGVAYAKAKTPDKETWQLNMPDETCDDIIDPDHPSLKSITWKQAAGMIKANKKYGFNLSDHWTYRGYGAPQTPESQWELSIVSSALHHLQNAEAGKGGQKHLPNQRTHGTPQEESLKSWSTTQRNLQRRKSSSLSRFFMFTGLTALAEAFNKKLGDVIPAGELVEGVNPNYDSVSILPEQHPVVTEQARIVEEMDPS